MPWRIEHKQSPYSEVVEHTRDTWGYASRWNWWSMTYDIFRVEVIRHDSRYRKNSFQTSWFFRRKGSDKRRLTIEKNVPSSSSDGARLTIQNKCAFDWQRCESTDNTRNARANISDWAILTVEEHVLARRVEGVLFLHQSIPPAVEKEVDQNIPRTSSICVLNRRLCVQASFLCAQIWRLCPPD